MRDIAAVRRAGLSDVELVAPLFDRYRQFYGREPDLELARQYLAERLARDESIVLFAETPEHAGLGFVQLYPTFSSVRAARIFILNDLFVVPSARRRGIATLLMRVAEAQAREARAVRLKLSTAASNAAAQALYESLGWRREAQFFEYNLDL